MSRYEVIWKDQALNELASIWTGATDRRAVTSAVAAIDGELASSGEIAGTELAEGLKELVVAPIRVLFELEEAGRVIRVVRTTASRSQKR